MHILSQIYSTLNVIHMELCYYCIIQLHGTMTQQFMSIESMTEHYVSILKDEFALNVKWFLTVHI